MNNLRLIKHRVALKGSTQETKNQKTLQIQAAVEHCMKCARATRLTAVNSELPCDFSTFCKNKRHIRVTSSNKLLNQTQLIILQMRAVQYKFKKITRKRKIIWTVVFQWAKNEVRKPGWLSLTCDSRQLVKTTLLTQPVWKGKGLLRFIFQHKMKF